MNRIVKANYPVSKLPEDLRVGLEPSSIVTVIVEEEEKRPEKAMTLDEIFALRRPRSAARKRSTKTCVINETSGMTKPVGESRIYFDANPLIYAIEGVESIAEPIRKVLGLLSRRPGVAVTSELTLAEVLPKAAVPRRRSYLNLIIFDLRPVTRDILVETADYRRKAKGRDGAMPKLPDSIHIVTAIQFECHTILSSDIRMKLPTGFSVVSPDQENLARLVEELS